MIISILFNKISEKRHLRNVSKFYTYRNISKACTFFILIEVRDDSRKFFTSFQCYSVEDIPTKQKMPSLNQNSKKEVLIEKNVLIYNKV